MTDYPGEKIAEALEHIAEGLCRIAAAINYQTEKAYPEFLKDIAFKAPEDEHD